MKKRSKRYKASLSIIDRTKKYSIKEAVELLRKFKPAKFDETVEISMTLGVDPKKSDQQIRGSVSLPRGIGKSKKVIVFAEGKEAEDARNAGADVVGGQDLIQKIQDGWLDFDVAISTSYMMRHVSKLGKILGPKGKMPSPKTGTVTDDIKNAVTEYKAGKIEYRVDSTGNIHGPVGKMSFSNEALLENISAFIEHIRSVRPPGVKGTYILGVSLSTTMGPGIPLDVK